MNATTYNPPGLWWSKAVTRAGGDGMPIRPALGEVCGELATLRILKAEAKAECEKARAQLKAQQIRKVRL